MRVRDAVVEPEGSASGLEGLPEPGLVRPADAIRQNQDDSYRRKRLVAWALTLLVFLSVPVLIALLALFG